MSTLNGEAAVRLQGIDHVVLRVASREAQTRFYVDVLGCRVVSARDDIGMSVLQAGDGFIDLMAADGLLGSRGGPPPAACGHNMDHFCLRVDGFDEERLRAHLAQHGAEVVRSCEHTSPLGRYPSLYLRDPEGNQIELKGQAE